MLTNGIEPLIRILIVGTVAYFALVGMLRVSGKRTLSKLNAFDLVVTIAIGSTLATTILSRDVSLLDGVVALGLLILLQFIVSWTVIRWPLAGRVIKAEPQLVAHRGAPIHDALRRERLTEGEIQAAARQAGFARVEDTAAIVLETDGSLSVIGPSGGG